MPISTRVLTSLILFMLIQILFSCEDEICRKDNSGGFGPVNVDFVTSNSVKISWESEYEPFESYTVKRNGEVISIITEPKIKSFIDYNLKPNTFYNYEITVEDLCDDGFISTGQFCWTLP